MVMINLLTTLTGYWLQFIIILNNLALWSASAPLTGLLLLALGKAVSLLRSQASGTGCSGRTSLLPEDLSQDDGFQNYETSQ